MATIDTTPKVRYRLMPGTSFENRLTGRPMGTDSSSVPPERRATSIAQQANYYGITLEEATEDIVYAPFNGHDMDDQEYSKLMKQISAETRSAVESYAAANKIACDFKGFERLRDIQYKLALGPLGSLIGGYLAGMSSEQLNNELSDARAAWKAGRAASLEA